MVRRSRSPSPAPREYCSAKPIFTGVRGPPAVLAREHAPGAPQPAQVALRAQPPQRGQLERVLAAAEQVRPVLVAALGSSPSAPPGARATRACRRSPPPGATARRRRTPTGSCPGSGGAARWSRPPAQHLEQGLHRVRVAQRRAGLLAEHSAVDEPLPEPGALHRIHVRREDRRARQLLDRQPGAAQLGLERGRALGADLLEREAEHLGVAAGPSPAGRARTPCRGSPRAACPPPRTCSPGPRGRGRTAASRRSRCGAARRARRSPSPRGSPGAGRARRGSS